MQGLVGEKLGGLHWRLTALDGVDHLTVVHYIADSIRGEHQKGISTVLYLKGSCIRKCNDAVRFHCREEEKELELLK